MKVAVNLTGVTDSDTLVTAINQAIENAGNGASQQATAFKNANITAAINTDCHRQTAVDVRVRQHRVPGAGRRSGRERVAGQLLRRGRRDRQCGQRHGDGRGDYTTPAANETVNFRIVGAGSDRRDHRANSTSPGDRCTDTTAAEAVTAINTAIAANTSPGGHRHPSRRVRRQDRLRRAAPGRASRCRPPATPTTAWASARSRLHGAIRPRAAREPPATSTTTRITADTAAVLRAAGTQNLQVSINGGATINLGRSSRSAPRSAGSRRNRGHRRISTPRSTATRRRAQPAFRPATTARA